MWVCSNARVTSPVSPALERKMSMRQSREELIKRGVLKEVFEKGDSKEHLPTLTVNICVC